MLLAREDYHCLRGGGVLCCVVHTCTHGAVSPESNVVFPSLNAHTVFEAPKCSGYA